MASAPPRRTTTDGGGTTPRWTPPLRSSSLQSPAPSTVSSPTSPTSLQPVEDGLERGGSSRRPPRSNISLRGRSRRRRATRRGATTTTTRRVATPTTRPRRTSDGVRRRAGSSNPTDLRCMRHRVRQKISKWKECGGSGQVLEWIRHGVKILWNHTRPPPPFNMGASSKELPPE